MTKKSRWFFILVGIIIFIFPWWLAYKYFWLSQPEPLLLKKNSPVVSCQKDSDCLPAKKELGVRYFCKDNKCQKEFLNNPAEVECQKNKGKVVKRINFKGGEYKVCVFPDKSECEVWNFFQKKCVIGQFNLKDNIWEGYLYVFRGKKYDDYFTMLNGETVGVTGKTQDIEKELALERDSGELLELEGQMVANSFEPNGKVLVVEKILNKTKLKALDNKKNEEKPTSTPSLLSATSTEATATSTNEKDTGEKSQNKIEDQIYGCEEFSLTQKCSNVYEPVCAKVQERKLGTDELSGAVSVSWRDFSSPCQACLYQTRLAKTVGYKMGKCSP